MLKEKTTKKQRKNKKKNEIKTEEESKRMKSVLYPYPQFSIHIVRHTYPFPNKHLLEDELLATITL